MESGGHKTYHAKFSEQKMTYPGTKQVYRFREADGRFQRDLIACAGEHVSGGEPLLQPVVRGGQRVVEPAEPLQSIRRRVKSQMESLPEKVRSLRNPSSYEVKFSRELQELLEAVRRRIETAEVSE